MLEAHALGLGTTWVGYFDENKLKGQFSKLNGYKIVGLFPIGYPAEDAAPSGRHFSRKTKEELVVEI